MKWIHGRNPQLLKTPGISGGQREPEFESRGGEEGSNDWQWQARTHFPTAACNFLYDADVQLA